MIYIFNELFVMFQLLNLNLFCYFCQSFMLHNFVLMYLVARNSYYATCCVIEISWRAEALDKRDIQIMFLFYVKT